MIHLLTIPVTLLVLKEFADEWAGHSVTWDQLWRALGAAGGTILCIGTAFQLVLGIAAAAAASLAFQGQGGPWTTTIFLGVFGIVFSIVIFGGFLGAVGGALTTTGGAIAKWSPEPKPPFLPLAPPAPPPRTP